MVPRGGVGVIWGPMKDPRTDFKGLSASISMNIALIGGANGKVAAIVDRDNIIKYLYVTVLAEVGATAEGSIHGNFGYVWDLSSVLPEKILNPEVVLSN